MSLSPLTNNRLYMKHPIQPKHPGLPVYLFSAYALLIAYASLSPFTGWRVPEGDVFHYLAVWPRYITRFDVLINIFAYFPLGFLAVLFLHRWCGNTVVLIVIATVASAVISLGMETLQVFVPGRIASVLDLLANTAGGLAGATLAQAFGSRPHLGQRLAQWRSHWFLQGRIADWGLVLLGLWLFIQANPSLPLMGVWPAQNPYPLVHVAAHFDMLLMLSILFNTLALGMLLSAILQPDRPLWAAALTFLAACGFLKWLAAAALLKPDVLFQWLSAESLVGIGYAGALLLPALRLRLRPQIWLMAACLVAGIVLVLLHADNKLPTAGLRLFDWRHGHLLNFNGFTRMLAEFWPLLALPYLWALCKKV